MLLVGIEEGHYRILLSPSPYCSRVGTNLKETRGTGLTHDRSSPSGQCLNANAAKEDDLLFQSVQDAVRHLRPGHYMAKVDIKSAYRSVRTLPTSWSMTGLHWTLSGDSSLTYMCDTRLLFLC